jgi:predicted RNA-binding Zn-ribbon protein involved in translation (DUF1610 family)
MTSKDKQDVIAVCNILADKMSDGGKVAVQQIIGAVEDMAETQSCDCVSRKDVIILIDEATELHPYKVIGDSETYSNYNQGWEDACNWLYANVEGDNLKTVTPQQKVGKWITQYNVAHQKEYYYCPNCGEEYSYDGETGIKMNDYNYCPNCGADMRESED